MPDSHVREIKATTTLKDDHKTVLALFQRYEKLVKQGGKKQAMAQAAPTEPGWVSSDGSSREDLFDQISHEIRIHTTLEEEIFYPAVEKGESRKGVEVVREAREEHKIIKTLITELESLSPNDEAFDAKMKVLGENVEHHAKEEERDMFPLFEKLPRETRDAVTDRLRARREDLTKSNEE